ncbi:MAG: S4 domain-containing protein [Bacteroidales bacterium]
MGVRIDKWLWSVRVFKTRSMASDACRRGRVLIDGKAVKPSRDVNVGDRIEVHQPPIVRTLEVKELLQSRVGAKLVPGFMEELTPESEFEKLRMAHEVKPEYRPRGLGRPTKKERRLIERIKKSKF